MAVSSAEVCTNSQEGGYDTFFVACHVCRVISPVLRIPLMSSGLVWKILITVCFPLMTHKHALCDYCLNECVLSHFQAHSLGLNPAFYGLRPTVIGKNYAEGSWMFRLFSARWPSPSFNFSSNMRMNSCAMKYYEEIIWYILWKMLHCDKTVDASRYGWYHCCLGTIIKHSLLTWLPESTQYLIKSNYN